MPSLNWIGKEAVVNHHKEVPFRLLEPVPELSCGDQASGNLIVEGDNLLALKALLPRYAGKVKCIYIDPPYNTGNEGWAYNDNVKSPEIQKWLREVVGGEGETLDRHDRWLCMMYPRLVLLRQFLREDGAIFVSIDDNEVGNLRLLMDEVFGGINFIGNIVWQKKYTVANDAKWLAENHDHVLLYARTKEIWRPNRLPRNEKMDLRYRNPDNHSKGPWKATPLYAKRNPSEEEKRFVFTFKNGYVWRPPSGTTARFPAETLARMDENNEIWFGTKGNTAPSRKTFLSELKMESPPAATIWLHSDAGHNHEAREEIKAALKANMFDTPKPTRLLQRILQIASDKESLILDSFAGSGTSGHAVLKQNAEDGGSRKFILVEMDPNIAQKVTAERVRRVLQGYTNARGEEVEGLGGGFQYCRLSDEPLFDPSGAIRSTVTFNELAEFVWFMETGSGMRSAERGVRNEEASAYLGLHNERAVFLLYNGILKDRSDIGGNVLNGRTLEYIDSLLPDFGGERVVYGARTRFDKKRLATLNITFHQLPYDLATKTWF
jgi:adenine-specific DNA-methyltransferase